MVRRPAVALAMALFASGASFIPGPDLGRGATRAAEAAARPEPAVDIGASGPGKPGPTPRAPAALSAEAPAPAWPPAGVRAAAGPAPADVSVEVEARNGGGARLTLTRRGHLVAVRHRGVSAAGQDWVAIELAPAPGGARDVAGAEDVLVWEATHLGTLETTRGLVHLASRGGLPDARLALAERPAPGPRDVVAGERTCAAHGDGGGGFVVICRFGRAAQRVRAVNVTGDRPLDGVWVVPAAGARGELVARLELPLAPGRAEARAVGYTSGQHGVVLRAEAIQASAAEAPTLLLASSRRAQPTTAGLGDEGRGPSAIRR